MSRRISRRISTCRQRGQAALEYIVVTASIVTVLVAGGDASAVSQLCAAFRSLYRAYSFTLSLP
jgi:L-lysine 2,3-aminomutase